MALSATPCLLWAADSCDTVRLPLAGHVPIGRTVGGIVYDVAAADLNSDGAGNFGALQSTAFPRTTYPSSLAVADFDGDGRMDLFSGNYRSRDVGPLANINTVSINAADASATEAGLNRAHFLIRRTGCVETPLTFSSTVSRAATAGIDYRALGGRLTRAPGQSAASLIVPVDDSAPEGLETVFVRLASRPFYATTDRDRGTVTILDNAGLAGRSARGRSSPPATSTKP